MSERVDKLIHEMTLEEKVAQLSGALISSIHGDSGLDVERLRTSAPNGLGHVTFGPMASTDPRRVADVMNQLQRWHREETRLGIPVLSDHAATPAFMYLPAAEFPTGLALAATWDPDVVQQMADIVRRQMRAVGVHLNIGPLAEVGRDPRLGRFHECFGEDPDLVAAMVVAYVRGIQGEDLREGVLDCACTFPSYFMPEGALITAAIRFGERELHDVYARPFEAAIREAGLFSVMSSSTEIDGVPVSASREILTGLLRERLGFSGFVVSDFIAIPSLVDQFKVAADLQEAAVQAFLAGLDVELPQPHGYGELLVDAVGRGLVPAERIDNSCRTVLEAKERLGLLEDPYVNAEVAGEAFGRLDDQTKMGEAADKGIVLLKNDNEVLPLSKLLKRIAVIGPLADRLRPLFGGFTGVAMAEFVLTGQRVKRAEGETGTLSDVPDEFAAAGLVGPTGIEGELEQEIQRMHPQADSVIDAIRKGLGTETEVLYAKGCDHFDTSTEGIAEAVALAARAEVTILVLGEKSAFMGDATGGPAGSVQSLLLPGAQEELLRRVVASGVSTVLVLITGRPLSIAWAAEHVPAILQCFYLGEEGGRAIAAALFGDTNPGGKLPVTIPRSVGQLPIYHDQRQGSGYRNGQRPVGAYADGPATPLYPFGHGLTYTTFDFSDITIEPRAVGPNEAVAVSCRITNSGARAGDEVVQCYVRDILATVSRPAQQLAGFARVSLDPGESCTVVFRIEVRQLAFLDRERRLVVEPGVIEVEVGASSDDIRVAGSFEVTGEITEVSRNRPFLARTEIH